MTEILKFFGTNTFMDEFHRRQRRQLHTFTRAGGSDPEHGKYSWNSAWRMNLLLSLEDVWCIPKNLHWDYTQVWKKKHHLRTKCLQVCPIRPGLKHSGALCLWGLRGNQLHVLAYRHTFWVFCCCAVRFMYLIYWPYRKKAFVVVLWDSCILSTGLTGERLHLLQKQICPVVSHLCIDLRFFVSANAMRKRKLSK